MSFRKVIEFDSSPSAPEAHPPPPPPPPPSVEHRKILNYVEISDIFGRGDDDDEGGLVVNINH